MAGSLPTFYGAEAQYPVTKTISFLTDITTSKNGTEQRRMARPPLIRFALRYHGMNFTDMVAMQTHFLANLGSQGSGIDMTIFGTVYHNMYYDIDQLLFERDYQSYGLALSFSQSIPYTTTYGTAMVNSGSSGWYPPYQIPYSKGFMFRTNKTVQPSGPKYARAMYGGGIRNYPTAPYGIWEFKFPITPQADATTIENAFLAQRGRLLTFSFRDPETVNTTAAYFQNCRFDNDELVQTYQSDGSISTNFSIRSVTA